MQQNTNHPQNVANLTKTPIHGTVHVYPDLILLKHQACVLNYIQFTTCASTAGYPATNQQRLTRPSM